MSCHIQSHLPHRKRKYIAQAEVAYSQQKHVLSAGADALDIVKWIWRVPRRDQTPCYFEGSDRIGVLARVIAADSTYQQADMLVSSRINEGSSCHSAPQTQSNERP